MNSIKRSATAYRLIIGLAIFVGALLPCAHAQFRAPSLSKEPFLLGAPVDLIVPKPPSPFKGSDGKTHLTYELHITNFSSAELLLQRIEILDANKSAVLASYSGQELKKRIFQPDTAKEKQGEKLGVAARTLVFISLDFAGPEIPTLLQHRVQVSAKEFSGQGEQTALGAKIAVAGNVRSIGPPLRGGPWLAGNGPSNGSGHRRASIAVDGSVHIAQRFATDWAKGGEDGDLFKGDHSKNSSYYGYGTEVLAVADGVVASTQDGILENIPDSNTTAVPINLETVSGNYVILDIGEGQYAFYAHLQPQSLRVKLGDTVRRGQVLALLGNSGNSEGPHLHFHISDGNSPLGSDGIPYVLDSYELLGKVVGEKFVPLANPEDRQHELPLEDNVVVFP